MLKQEKVAHGHLSCGTRREWCTDLQSELPDLVFESMSLMTDVAWI